MQKKFAHDEQRMNKILGMAPGSSALSILRTLREMDDEEK
jgi:hypothetical protein